MPLKFVLGSAMLTQAVHRILLKVRLEGGRLGQGRLGC